MSHLLLYTIPKEDMKFRFRIHSDLRHDEMARYATIEEVVKFAKHYDLDPYNYTVEDKELDAELGLKELLDAWNRGERPSDLSTF